MKFNIKICDWDKKREWLNENKIFFETIATVLLAIMAIVVSLEANQIASYQTKIMKAEQSPILHFKVDEIYDPTTNNYARDELIISNVGSPLNEFKYDYVVFFKIESGPNNESPKTALIPLEGYYYNNVITNQPTGELARIANDAIPQGNNNKSGQLIRAFSKYAEERNVWGQVGIVRFVQVIYTDIFGDNHIEYYYVSPLKVFRLPEDEGIKIFEDYREKNKKLQDVDFYKNVSSEMLYEKWSDIINENKVN